MVPQHCNACVSVQPAEALHQETLSEFLSSHSKELFIGMCGHALGLRMQTSYRVSPFPFNCRVYTQQRPLTVEMKNILAIPPRHHG